MIKRICILIAVSMALCSCELVNSLIHDDDVVASVGRYKLYASQLAEVLPAGLSAEDSTAFAHQYIRTWAGDLLFLDLAERQLSKAEKDVAAELEDYRRSLLKYRYEQHYISDRLDTLVTDSQVEQYYNAHQEMFALERPVVKVRYVDILKDSQNKDAILKLISSSKVEDIEHMDSLAYASALKYFDSSDRWIDIAVVAREFDLEPSDLLSKIKDSQVRVESSERGDVKAAYFCDMQKSGTAPVEYCSERIRDIILSARKHKLALTLEQDLLDDALEHNKLIIY